MYHSEGSQASPYGEEGCGGTVSRMSLATSSERAIALVTVPVLLAIALAGCGSAGSNDPPGIGQGEEPGSASPTVEAGGEFADADVEFLTMMIPHHEQAEEMSEAILAKPGIDEQVAVLAEQIKDEGESEVELMESLLEDWGMDDDDADGVDGMTSEDDVEALEAATGSEAARLYLEAMIAHHEDGVEIAESEMDEGINPDALELARAIIDAHTAELSTMKDLVAEM